MTSPGFSWRLTCEACPVQLDGEVDGMRWYFRARGTTWEFGVGATDQEADWASEGLGEGFRRTGEYLDSSDPGSEHAAGYMAHADALAIIESSVAEYRGSRR